MPEPIGAEALADRLPGCLDVPRWVDELVAGAPWPDADALADAAETAAEPFTVAEVDGALAHHPRIGEQPSSSGADAEFSLREQAAIGSDAENGDDEAALAAAIAQGNRDYEERFGRVFLIRAAGRTRTGILGELQRRLANDDETELGVVADELRQIAALRIRSIWESA